MDLALTSAFPTLIGQVYIPDAAALNQELRAIILAEEIRYASLGRSNVGGWHSRTDFLQRPEPVVAGLTTWITWAVRKLIETSAGPGTFRGTLALSAWSAICRAGAY